MNDRDQFAAAALTGLLAGSEHNRDVDGADHAETAYYIADAMLRERDRTKEKDASFYYTTHDAAPAAKACGRGRENADTPACAGTGKSREPAAWGLPNADGDALWATSLDRGTLERHCPTNQSLIPLYRHSQPTLTDAERAAIGRSASWLAKAAESRRELHSAGYLLDDAATLRGLLERLK